MTARKVMLLGEIGVGKSSIVQRLVFDKFEATYKPTIGVDVYRYDVPKSDARDGITLIVWDTDGNFGDAIFRHIYMKEAAAALIIGDLSRPPTLDSMVKLGSGFADAFPGRHIGYVVNKTDLLPDAEARPLPAELTRPEISLIRTSAKTGDHVPEAFISAADCIARRGQ